MDGGKGRGCLLIRVAVLDGCASDREAMVCALRAQDPEMEIVKCASAEEFFQGDPFQIAFVALLWDGREEGIDIARRINAEQPECSVVFCTNYPELSPDAYSARHACLITKSRLEELLPRALALAKVQCAQPMLRPLAAPHRGGVRFIQQEQLLYAERQLRTSYLHLCGGEIVATPKKLSELLEELDAVRFIRCHTSYLVNIGFVLELQRQSLVLVNGAVVPVSRSYRAAVRRTLSAYTGCALGAEPDPEEQPDA